MNELRHFHSKNAPKRLSATALCKRNNYYRRMDNRMPTDSYLYESSTDWLTDTTVSGTTTINRMIRHMVTRKFLIINTVTKKLKSLQLSVLQGPTYVEKLLKPPPSPTTLYNRKGWLSPSLRKLSLIRMSVILTSKFVDYFIGKKKNGH